MIIFHRQMLDEPAYYEDGDGKRYRRLVGGIGWPQAGKAGFAVVISENHSDPPQYVVMDSLEDHNAYALMQACKGLELEFPVKAWHGDIYNRPMMQLLFEFNKSTEKGNRFNLQGAPQSGEPHNSGYYLPLVIERVKAGQKQLSVGKSAALLAAITELDPKVHLNQNIAEFPVLAALCYPLAYLLSYKPVFQRPEPVNQYGKLGWML